MASISEIPVPSAKSHRIIFGFFIFFSVFLAKFLKYLIISLTFKPIPFWLSVLLSLIGGFSGSVFFCLFLKLDNHSEDQQGRMTRFKQTITTYLSLATVWLFIHTLFEALAKFVMPGLPPLSLLHLSDWTSLADVKNIPYLAAGFITLLLVTFALSSGIILSLQKSSILKSHKIFFKTPLFLLKQPNIFITQLGLGLLLAIVYFSAHQFLEILIGKLSITPLLEMFFNGIVNSAVAALLFTLLITVSIKQISKSRERFSSMFQENPIWISPVILFATLIAFILLTLPLRAPFSGYLKSTVENDYRLAEKHKSEGQYDLAVFFYKRSHSLSKATMGYIKLLMSQKDSSVSTAEKNTINGEAEAIYKKLETESPISGVFYYLNSLRLSELKSPDSQRYLLLASTSSPELPNAQFELMGLFKSKNDHTSMREGVGKIVKQQGLLPFKPMAELSLKDLKALYDMFDALSKQASKNFPLAAYYYYDSKLYPEAQAELATLAKDMPEDVTVQYLTAMVDLEMMADNKKYDQALKAVDSIYKKFPKETWARDLKIQVAMKAGDTGILEKTLEEAYWKNSSDLDVSEQYAYSLMKKNPAFNLGIDDKKAEQIIDKVLKQDDSRWFSHYCKAILNLKKQDFGGSLDSLAKFSALIQYDTDLRATFDDLYYLYVLKYKNFISSIEAKKALEGRKDSDQFAYNYIMGTYFWAIKDFENGVKLLTDTIDIRDDLSKPHFLLGNVYFENAFLKKVPDNYLSALTEYKKSIAIFAEDPYTWFSLGHVYRKLDRDEEALGAFQKTLFYMPAEDHNMDYYGVSIHAKMQVEEIQNKLNKGK